MGNQSSSTATHLHIAIDGYSACGKSTLSRDIAQEFGILHVDTGLMYRAITYSMLQHSIDPSKNLDVQSFLQNIDYQIVVEDQKQKVFINHELINKEARTAKIDQHVSEIASISSVRRFLVHQQQLLAKSISLVMDGRDIGTVVLPNAKIKLFLQADLHVRAKRRLLERQNQNTQATLEEVKDNLSRRDRIDSTREDSPLVQAKDAVLLDTTNLTRLEQLRMSAALIRERM